MFIEEETIEKFCKDLKELATEIINYEEKYMIPLTDNEFMKSKISFMKSKKNATYVKNSFLLIKMKKRNLKYTKKLEIIVIIQENLEKQLIAFAILAEEFKGQFECLGENTEKYITFSIPIKKEHDNGKTITYKIKFIDSCRKMSHKLSNLVDDLFEINNKDCKTCVKRKNIKSERDFIGFKNNRSNYWCKECKGTSIKSVNELIEKFPIDISFCEGDLNKFVLLLRKGVYPYEFMDS